MTPPDPLALPFIDPERAGITHKIDIDDEGNSFDGYVTANVTPDGRLREVFLHGFGKDGSTLRGWTNFTAILFSLFLQNGGSLALIAQHVEKLKFPPQGETMNPEIPYAPSVPAYVVTWLALRFGTDDDRAAVAKLIQPDSKESDVPVNQ